MTTPGGLRPAATVVVLRPGADQFEVLLVRRSDRVAFMAGAFVFPGGRVDAADHEAPPVTDEPVVPRFSDLDAADEAAFRRAGVRELHEEAAVAVDPSDLVPFAHWVTPEIETRRYDTRFFVTMLPPGQIARHDEGETTELAWWTPGEALDRCRRGDIMLPPPTWTTLRQLEPHPTTSDVLRWARAVRIVRIQPEFLVDGQVRLLTLPGDPSFPGIDGWDVPRETRFALREGGGWLPLPR